MFPEEQEAKSFRWAANTFRVRQLKTGRWVIYNNHGDILVYTDDLIGELFRLQSSYVAPPPPRMRTPVKAEKFDFDLDFDV